MKVLITGANGFLGSETTKFFLNSGHDVLGIDKNKLSTNFGKKIKFLQLDLSKSALPIDFQPNLIIHTASTLPFGGSKNDFEQNNIASARNISMYASSVGAFLVNVSSSSVYGKPANLPINAFTNTSPLDQYAKSKLIAENEIATVIPRDQFSIVRPRTILGQQRQGIFSIFFRLIQRGLPIPLPNSGRQIIQFVHVSDLVRLVHFLGTEKISGTWPAGSLNPIPIRKHLKLLSDASGIPIRYLPVNSKIFEVGGNFASDFKLTKFTRWHFSSFPYDNYFDPQWVPENFSYENTCHEAFLDVWNSIEKFSGKSSRKTKLLSNVGLLI